jgi:transcriptional regulator with XRE-family HTH domain
MPNPIHDPRYKLFREMLTGIRKDKSLLQSEVAEKLGKNQSFVSKYERGERRLDLPEFLDVAAALEINPAEFIKKYKEAMGRLR